MLWRAWSCVPATVLCPSAREPQALSPHSLEPALCTTRSRSQSGEPARRNAEAARLPQPGKSLRGSDEDPVS